MHLRGQPDGCSPASAIQRLDLPMRSVTQLELNGRCTPSPFNTANVFCGGTEAIKSRQSTTGILCAQNPIHENTVVGRYAP